MPHDINGSAEIHYYRGSAVPLEGVIDGNPDLTQPGHELEFYLSPWHDLNDPLASKSTASGITQYSDGRYEVTIEDVVTSLKNEVPYVATIFYTPSGGKRDVTAQVVLRIVPTADGSE